MTINGSGKIGGPPIVPSQTDVSRQPPASSQTIGGKAPDSVDRFEQARALVSIGLGADEPPHAATNGPSSRSVESRLSNFLRAACDTPNTFKAYVSALHAANEQITTEMSQLKTRVNELLLTMAAAEAPDEVLAQVGQELTALRERMRRSRRSFNRNRRRLAALGTIANHVPGPMPKDDLTSLIDRLGCASSGLERRQLALALGKFLLCLREEAPEHLRGVTRLPVPSGMDDRGPAYAAEVFDDQAPLGLVAQLAATAAAPLAADPDEADDNAGGDNDANQYNGGGASPGLEHTLDQYNSLKQALLAELRTDPFLNQDEE